MYHNSYIMDATKICSNFPACPINEIQRDSFLDTIENLFEKYRLVIIEGKEGAGKTTLLAQFAKRNNNNAITIFINQFTQSSLNLDLIRLDLLCQAWWIINNREISDEELETIDINSQWSLKRIQLQKKMRASNQKIYFIIDGISDIPENLHGQKEMILDLLPFGCGNEFRFLMTGEINQFPERIVANYPTKEFLVSSYTLGEACKAIADLDFTPEDVAYIYKDYKFPGQYASIRRIIESGLSITDFLNNMPANTQKLTEVEWKNIDFNNTVLMRALSVVAFATMELLIDDISDILNIARNGLSEILQSVPFISVTDNKVNFVSESQLKYAQLTLENYKEECEALIINYLLHSTETKSITDLSTFFEKTNRYNDLLKFLTPDTLIKILKENQSLVPLLEQTKLGVTAANRVERDGHMISFGLQHSIVEQLFTSDIWESEINALLAIKDTESALALVERATTKEDRLFLLSILANAKVIHNLSIDGLEERIINAYHYLDHNKLGKKAEIIASNLVNSLPDIAFSIIENNLENNEKERDRALAKLSIKLQSTLEDENSSQDIVEKINGRIQDPKAQNFLTRNSILFFNFSSSKIIAEAEKINRVNEKLHLLRTWITKNRKNKDVEVVVEFALEIAITTTTYAPNARDYREIASPLPYIKDLEQRKSLISKVDSQLGNIERFGPAEEYIRILLLLGASEKEINRESCQNRITEAYLYAAYINDIPTRSSCLARISSFLALIDPDYDFENDKLHSATNSDLEKNIDLLQNNTADQYVIFKGVITALAKNRTDYAIEIASQLNGEYRRNRAYYDLTIAILQMSENEINIAAIWICLQKISAKFLHDDLLVQILSRFNNFSDEFTKKQSKKYELINLIFDIQDSIVKCNAICLALQLLNKTNDTSKGSLKQNLINSLLITWENLDIGCIKVDVGFKIVEALSNIADLTDYARIFLSKVEEFRNTIILDSNDTTLIYIASSKLALRAYSGLLKKDHDTDPDYLSIKSIITQIPSMTEQIGLLTELALIFKCAGREEKFAEVVDKNIRPYLNNIPLTDGLCRQLAIIKSAPALYLHHQTSALELIKTIEFDNVRDEAYNSICQYILTKVFLEPIPDPTSNYCVKLTQNEITDIITLLRLIEYDSLISVIISQLVNCIHSYKNAFTKTYKAEIARKLTELAREKLPNEKYIKHDGYKIVAFAHIFKLIDTNKQDWLTLVDETKKINIADRVFILSHIAECLPNKQIDLKKLIVIDAEELIKELPSVFDQIDRYLFLSQSSNLERKNSERLLKSGMELLIHQNDSNLYIKQKKYIDYAYKLDPEFASRLASLADDDPAREKTKDNIYNRIESLNIKKSIIDSDNGKSEDFESKKSKYPSIAWDILLGLNTNRISPMKFDSLREVTMVAASLPLSSSYPIYSFIIQNCVERYAGTPQASEYIRPLFEATITSCHLILSIAKKSTAQIKNAKSQTNKLSFTSLLLVDKEFEEVKIFLKDWLKSNLENELIIADPYFGLDDLWILKFILEINKDCKTKILTSRAHNENIFTENINIQDYWKIKMSDQDPPDTEIIIASMGSSKQSPIHDRWWITGEKGLSLGSSLNGLGGARISEISVLDENTTKTKKETILRFTFYKEREYKNQKIQYTSITL